ncbi:MAG: hypothetical protein IT355_07865 [Gemmatimonadaceae bacterium]|nr:hypothetical protein [Gemmatimonadaceae bacterium]
MAERPFPTVIESARDPALEARITRRVAMHYADGEDAQLDRPGHVRAASSMAWIGGRIALVQDDVNFVALVDPVTGLADAVTLPAGKGDLRQFDDGRGNKKHKLDLEAMTRVPETGGTTLLAFGSGSKKRRENVLSLRFRSGGTALAHDAPALVHLPALYAALRAEPHFAGSEMNIEGAMYTGGAIRLFGRGNGEATDDLEPCDATCDLSWALLRAHIADPDRHPVPPLQRITQYRLGAIDGVALGFTDAIPAGRSNVLYTAAAEASEDAGSDGAVGGSAIGVLPNDRRRAARWTAITDERGAPFGGKVEGVVLHPHHARRALVVVDLDDHTSPSELCEVELRGAWW